MLTLSLVWGILAFLGMFIAFLPCLGSLNWLNLPFSAIGLVIGIISVVTAKEKPKGSGIAGIILCAVALIFGIIRLAFGGGVL